MTHHRFLPALALATLAIALAACSSPTPRPTPSPAAPAVDASVGEELRADGWTLSVDGVKFDDTASVAAANEFNPVPDANQQYAVVTMTVTRTAVPSTGIGIDIALVIDEERVAPAAAVPTTPLHLLTEFPTGTPVTGQLVFLVPKGTESAEVQVAVDTTQAFLVGAK